MALKKPRGIVGTLLDSENDALVEKLKVWVISAWLEMVANEAAPTMAMAMYLAIIIISL